MNASSHYPVSLWLRLWTFPLEVDRPTDRHDFIYLFLLFSWLIKNNILLSLYYNFHFASANEPSFGVFLAYSRVIIRSFCSPRLQSQLATHLFIIGSKFGKLLKVIVHFIWIKYQIFDKDVATSLSPLLLYMNHSFVLDYWSYSKRYFKFWWIIILFSFGVCLGSVYIHLFSSLVVS